MCNKKKKRQILPAITERATRAIEWYTIEPSCVPLYIYIYTHCACCI
jgi:hypothetical protein